jgi:glycogen phosphorylase
VQLNTELKETFEAINGGVFGDLSALQPLFDTILTGSDHYLVSNDFSKYLQALEEADKQFKNKTEWTKKCIMAASSMGKFSSDRCIKEYAEGIWNLKSIKF